MRTLTASDFHGGALVTEPLEIYWVRRDDDFDWLDWLELGFTFEDGFVQVRGR